MISVLDTFLSRGIAKVDQLVPEEVVASVRVELHESLEREGVLHSGSYTGARLNGLKDISVQSQLMKRQLKPVVKKSELFTKLQSDEIQRVAQSLVDDQSLVPMALRPQLLFTLPNAARWHVPNNMWHLDMPRLGEAGCPGVQMFVLIDRVEPTGGGTLAVAGSHHLVNDEGVVRSKDVKSRLQQMPYFEQLFEKENTLTRPEAPGEEQGVPLDLVEMTGEPGDVYFMDLRVIHTLAPNALDRPRLMATQRYLLEDIDASFLDA